MVEGARVVLRGGAVEALGKVEDPGNNVFCHGERATHPSRGRHDDVAAPEIAAQQVAGTGRALMKPFQPRRPRA
jgi:hypothetical protein